MSFCTVLSKENLFGVFCPSSMSIPETTYRSCNEPSEGLLNPHWSVQPTTFLPENHHLAFRKRCIIPATNPLTLRVC